MVQVYWLYYTVCNVSLLAECVCSIREYDKEDENEMLAAKHLKIRGYYSYTLPCGGIVTSVEARGFCDRPDDVELRLLTGKIKNLGFEDVARSIFLAAKCNETPIANASGEYEGFVRNNSLNFHVPRGYALVVDLNPDCSNDTNKCYFEPAIINKTSSYDVALSDSHQVWSETNVSLFLSVNITGALSMPTLLITRYYLISLIHRIKRRHRRD